MGTEYSNLFVCLMGMGTVFFGLICLIVLTDVMGRLLGRHPAAPGAAVPAPAPAAPAPDTPLSPEAVAALSAAIAQELGTDITGIRIKSIKKL